MKKTIKIISFLSLVLLNEMAFAQQDARFTQFMFNQAIINPAFVGSEKNLYTTMFYRNQWTNFHSQSDINEFADFKSFNQSPKTISFSTHSAFGGSSITGDHPMGAGLNVIQEDRKSVV